MENDNRNKSAKQDDVDVSRRNFIGGSFKYGATAAVGVAATTTSPPADAFFITLAKVYGELVGMACRLPTLMAYEYTIGLITEFTGTANTGAMSTYMTGTDKGVEIQSEANDEEIARQGEPSPNLCAAQSMSFEQQRYLYRDTEIANEVCISPPVSNSVLNSNFEELPIKLLIEQNGRTRNLNADERNKLASGFRSLGLDVSYRTKYDSNRFSEYSGASEEVRRMLAYQALSVVSTGLVGDERFASNQQSLESFSSSDWRGKIAGAGGETGLYAEASRLIGQCCHNEHQLLLAEEKLMVVEALNALQRISSLLKR